MYVLTNIASQEFGQRSQISQDSQKKSQDFPRIFQEFYDVFDGFSEFSKISKNFPGLPASAAAAGTADVAAHRFVTLHRRLVRLTRRIALSLVCENVAQRQRYVCRAAAVAGHTEQVDGLLAHLLRAGEPAATTVHDSQVREAGGAKLTTVEALRHLQGDVQHILGIGGTRDPAELQSTTVPGFWQQPGTEVDPALLFDWRKTPLPPAVQALSKLALEQAKRKKARR